MKRLILLATVLMASPAFADGFICEDQTGTLRIKVYNQTQPQLGTRNVAALIVSNPSASAGEHTIASFTSGSSVLTKTSSTYDAQVDVAASSDDTKDAVVYDNVKLSDLDDIILQVNFSYSHPVPQQNELSAEVILKLKSGASDMSIDAQCTRYLKN